MEQIYTLYYNDYGIAFQWKQNQGKDIHKIQLVFREMGLFLTKEELLLFKNQIINTLLGYTNCDQCTNMLNCRSMLLETPIKAISFAVSKTDLKELKNLVDGTIFQLNYNVLLSTNNIKTF